MQINSKTFRLFISSTFSDFQVEREILQTKVFPDIKEYCSIKGYTFQPIDLRWGVNNEAQLDQKALEMCIKEVQSCKTHDYPNFLIMLGDRYGWVPLPNIIEKNEFGKIIQNLDIEKKEYLASWYYEDANQIPISYILKQRTGEYEDYDKWVEVESKLRDIFQNSVSDLDEYFKKKYFTSATEAEAIEGIISYSQKSEFQQKLIKLVPSLEKIDHKNIFGFFRDIDQNSIIENQFIIDDYKKAQEFKSNVKKQLIDENILNVNTSLTTQKTLDEHYLEEFITSITNFLKQQIDNKIEHNTQNDYSYLELEKEQQYNYLNQKLENFLGQEKILIDIQNYIFDENDKPLIICGPSGIGKSSIIAQAIENTTTNIVDKKIIYRFIGATPNSTTTKDLLSSILEELNISIEDENQDSIENQFLTDIDKEENNFVNFSDTFYNTILEIKDDIVIFIDAVDQLTNDDQFLWLPNKLPSNIKIILSTLKDKEYKEDSKYFYTLEDKISKFIEVEPFNKPLKLLDLLLKKQNRTLQKNQKQYFLEQYNQVKTPLYVYMAANQIQYWKNSDIVDTDVTLSLSQKDIVNDFIKVLNTIHHHDKLLIRKVFGYILASKDGLSEYEILELLNTDKEFIKYLAPDTWHTNTTQELPLVIWTRLYSHIKPFLKTQKQYGQDLLYFFHREFIYVVENETEQQKEHKKAIEATQKLIEINIDKNFDSNRWGKLYVSLLLKYYLYYNNEDIVKQYYDKVVSKFSINSLIKYLDYIESIKEEFKINDNLLAKEHLIKIMIYLTNKFKSLSEEIYFKYITSLHYQTDMLILNKDFSKAIEIEENNIVEIENIPTFKEITKVRKLKETKHNDKNIDIELKWFYLFFEIKKMLEFAYIMDKNKVMSIQLSKETHLLLKEFYENNPKNRTIEIFYYDQMIYYTMALQLNGVFLEAINILKESLSVLEKHYKEDNKNFQLKDMYAKALYVFSGLLFSVKDKKWYEYFLKSYKIYTELLKYNFFKYSKTLIELNNYFINNYNINNMFLQSEPYYKNNIMLLNRQSKEGVEEKIKEISDDLYIKVLNLKDKNKRIELFFVNKRLIEYVFNFDKEYWAKFYVNKLIALGGLLNKSMMDDKKLSIAEPIQKEGVDICEKYMTEDDEWYDLYTKSMNNLANTYMYLNKKDESYDLSIKNLDISIDLFQKNPNKWFRAYYYALQNMAGTYFYNGDDKNERVCKDKIKELELSPIFQLQKDVIENKSTNKKIKYFDYFHKALLLLGTYFFIKYVFLE